MTTANDSVLITPGVGATIASHTAAAKEHQVMMLADQAGQIWGSKPSYFWQLPYQVHVAVANTVHWDFFNADATIIVRVIHIVQIPSTTIVVTGTACDWLLERTTTVGTGGTALTAWLPDLSQTALSVTITARSKPTGGATASTDLRQYAISSDEGSTSAIQLASMGGLELVPEVLRPVYGGQGIVLRQNQGIRCVQVTTNPPGNTAWLIGFTTE